MSCSRAAFISAARSPQLLPEQLSPVVRIQSPGAPEHLPPIQDYTHTQQEAEQQRQDIGQDCGLQRNHLELKARAQQGNCYRSRLHSPQNHKVPGAVLEGAEIIGLFPAPENRIAVWCCTLRRSDFLWNGVCSRVRNRRNRRKSIRISRA